MNLKEFVEQRRGLAQDLSKTLKINQSLISAWANGIRQVPAERCPEIEKVTDGVVTCEEMRPDVDWQFLRGTKKKIVAA